MLKRFFLFLTIFVFLISAIPVFSQTKEKADTAIKKGSGKMTMDLRSDRSLRKKGDHRKRIKRFKRKKGHFGKGFLGFKMKRFKLVILCMLLIRILLAIAIAKDVEQRSNLSKLWIFIVLLGGIPAAIAYALLCISLKKA